jgi:hypothetical protein
VGFSRLENIQYQIGYGATKASLAQYRANPLFLTGNAVNPEFPSPYTQQWTVGVQRQIGAAMALDLSYAGNHALNLVYNSYPNRIDRVTGIRPNPGIGDFRYLTPDESTHYNSFQAAFQGRFSNGLVFNLNYTWSRAISYADGDLLQGGNGPQDFFNRTSERGPAPFDIPQRFTTDVVYELPFNRFPAASSSAVARTLLQGWQVSSIFGAQSGAPLNISQGSQNIQGQRVDYVGGDPYLPDAQNTKHYLNAASFAPVPTSPASQGALRAGTLGRNAIRGVGTWNIDLALAKNTKISERTELQLRLDAFNVLNHPIWTSILTDVFNSRFGQLTGTNTPRTVQINARFQF